MRRWFHFKNLKVRTSVVLVLVFFLLMLIAGAALGVLSLHFANRGLQTIVQQQNVIKELNQANEQFLTAQSFLEQSAAEQAYRNLVEFDPLDGFWNEPLSVSSSGSKTALQRLEWAEQAMQESKTYFNVAMQLASHDDFFADKVASVKSSFQEIEQTVFPQQLAALNKQEIGFYQQITGEARNEIEKFSNEVANLANAQLTFVDNMAAQERQQFSWVVRLVVLGMLACVGMSILAYVFLNKMVLRPLRHAGQHFERIASGDLTQVIQSSYRNEIGVLYQAVEQMQRGLMRLVYTIRQGVNQTDHEVNGLHHGASELSRRTEQQAAALQETAASMEQLSSTVRQNSHNAKQADNMAREASVVVEQAGQAVFSVVKVMDEISSSSTEISEIVNVIDGIAFQTNILALNASVEAARAGEHGRGFAVVAGEVRSLAQRSAQAAQEIKELIEGSLKHINNGHQQANEAGTVVKDVVQTVQQVSTLMSEISVASNEQSLGIEQVNIAMTQMDSAVRFNADLVQDTVQAIDNLQQQTMYLTEVVSEFNVADLEQVNQLAPQTTNKPQKKQAKPKAAALQSTNIGMLEH